MYLLLAFQNFKTLPVYQKDQKKKIGYLIVLRNLKRKHLVLVTNTKQLHKNLHP